MNKKCETCKNWKPSETVGLGRCHLDENERDAARVFPLTFRQDWCGEWREKPQTEETK